jgi:hypothetical protein
MQVRRVNHCRANSLAEMGIRLEVPFSMRSWSEATLDRPLAFAGFMSGKFAWSGLGAHDS